MEDWVRDTIRRAKAERWTFLDLGNAGLDQFPEELLAVYRHGPLVLEVMFPITYGGVWDYPYPEAQVLMMRPRSCTLSGIRRRSTWRGAAPDPPVDGPGFVTALSPATSAGGTVRLPGARFPFGPPPTRYVAVTLSAPVGRRAP